MAVATPSRSETEEPAELFFLLRMEEPEPEPEPESEPEPEPEPESEPEPEPEYLTKVSKFVKDKRGHSFPLVDPLNPPGSSLTIATLEDTIYRDEPEEVDGWGKFYLRETVNMEVLGVVEGTSCPADELVLMTCEDKKLYAYDGEELHMVAKSLLLQQLVGLVIEYPSTERYYNGQAFEDMTEEDWAKVKRSDVGRKLDQEHEKLVEAHKATFLENLKSQK